MTTPPDFTPAGADLYDRLEPWAANDPANGYALAWVCQAIAFQFEEVYTASSMGLDAMDDPDTAPDWYLLYLAMKAGVRLIPEGLTVEQQRARVRSTDGKRRGTIEAIIGAARQHLSDPQEGSVILLERRDAAGSDEPYHFVVITYTSQTPYPALVEAALLEQKPVGHILHYLVVDGWTVGLFEAAYAGLTIGDMEGDFNTVYDFEINTP